MLSNIIFVAILKIRRLCVWVIYCFYEVNFDSVLFYLKCALLSAFFAIVDLHQGYQWTRESRNQSTVFDHVIKLYYR